jgi:D-sedoheptulose 7-phosphate isomerase
MIIGDLFRKNLNEHQELFKSLDSTESQVIEAIQIIVDSLKSGGKIMFCGNGGSAADCQHLAAEFTGRFIKDRVPIAAISLTTDTSALTCISNDYNYDEVFSRQLIALGKKGDCIIAISTSGNSKNVVKAVNKANELGIYTIGLLGNLGGELIKICKSSILISHPITARIQEAHIFIGHTICGAVEIELGLV